jgi:hypothetical protein
VLQRTPEWFAARVGKVTASRNKDWVDPLRLTDEQINHRRRFAGLPLMDATEIAQWRGYLRWMKERFGRPSNSDTTTMKIGGEHGQDHS